MYSEQLFSNHLYLSNGRRFPRRNATSGMVPHVFYYSGVSKPQFLIPIEHQVNQQCRNINANIVVGFAATTSKRQLPEHILLPEHSSHVKFRAMGSASLFGWAGRRQIEATGENEHPSFPDLFCKFFCGQQRNMQQESQFCPRIVSVSPRTQPCCKKYFCLQKMFWMHPVNGIQDQVCDFRCCFQIKCIRTICGTRLGQPQPRLVLWGS